MTITLTPSSIKQFHHKILSWYEHHQRSLPWRDVPFGTSFCDIVPANSYDTRAYKILVSEVMSQQTQLMRVIPKYVAWMELFPTIDQLAQASVSEILRAWSGLGYNRRALNLQRTAKIIYEDYQGVWPKTIAGLKQLPGIGDYTAAALACFAFGQQVAVLDTNVRKVILLEFFNPSDTLPQQELQRIADQLLPKTDAYHWNQALMDYAAAVLKAEKITIPKQSRFVGSHRYYRGKILKLLLAHANQLPVSHLAMQLKEGGTQMDGEMLKRILQELEQDGFVKQRSGYVKIATKPGE